MGISLGPLIGKFHAHSVNQRLTRIYRWYSARSG